MTDTQHATAEALARLHAASFTQPRPWSVAEFTTLLAAPCTLLALRADRTTDGAGIATAGGFALARVLADEAELLTIAVLPPLRGHGLGAALLAEVMEAVEARGATALFLEVARDNDIARRLYSTAGFREVGCRPGYYAGTDALVLKADLPVTG